MNFLQYQFSNFLGTLPGKHLSILCELQRVSFLCYTAKKTWTFITTWHHIFF